MDSPEVCPFGCGEKRVRTYTTRVLRWGCGSQHGAVGIPIQSRTCKLAVVTAERDKLAAEVAGLRKSLREEIDDWAEADDALEAAGIVMHADGYKKPLVDGIKELAAERDKLLADNHRLRLGDMSVFDYERLVEWIKNPERKEASFAFTAGSLRTACIAVQDSGVLKLLAAIGEIEKKCQREMSNPSSEIDGFGMSVQVMKIIQAAKEPQR